MGNTYSVLVDAEKISWVKPHKLMYNTTLKAAQVMDS